MRLLIHEVSSGHTPESLAELICGESGLVLLRTGTHDGALASYSFVAARPFLTFRSSGSRCDLRETGRSPSNSTLRVQYGNPWAVLEGLMARFELLEEVDLPFPLGGCFGYWGYDLKNFVEPKLARRALNDLELPDCQVGFYGSLVVFNHRLGKIWVVATGLEADGTRSHARARSEAEFWQGRLKSGPSNPANAHAQGTTLQDAPMPQAEGTPERERPLPGFGGKICSSLERTDFLARVERALNYIWAGDIYQVNLSHRLSATLDSSGWAFFERLSAVSPAPFSAYLDCGEFQIASSSPESFLRLSGGHIQTRPIKGTRPRAADPTRDAQLTYELQTNPKEMAELVMITDLLRNDLGRICEFGSVQVPELVRLERYPQVQHLVSTVEGRLRPEVTHFAALASCFPGGSITGAPKFRAMEIIEELEALARGPYTGALGYLGFNRESQLSIAIRTAICRKDRVYFSVGAGIVADSIPEAEYEETLAKARGFFEALQVQHYDGIPEWPDHSRRASRGLSL